MMFFMLVVLLIGQLRYSEAASRFNNLEIDASSVEGDSAKFESNWPVSPEARKSNFDSQPAAQSLNQIIARRQVESNQIGTGLIQTSNSYSKTFNSMGVKDSSTTDDGQTVFERRGFFTGNLNHSPSDIPSSSRQSGSSLANEIARLFNVNHGHYSETYEKLDRPHATITTAQNPEDALDDSIRRAVRRIMGGTFRRHRHHHRPQRHRDQVGNRVE